jgi:hypothetical protein
VLELKKFKVKPVYKLVKHWKGNGARHQRTNNDKVAPYLIPISLSAAENLIVCELGVRLWI